jgi:amino acid adenylation domain-containing protein
VDAAVSPPAPEAALQGFRLSPQQRRLWRLLEDNPGAYRAQLVLRIEGALDPVLLRAALERLLCRHEILRTVYIRSPGLRFPVQVVRGEAGVEFDERNLCDGSSQDREERLAELIENDAWPAPLEGSPPLRVTLRKIATGEHLLLLSISPLATDAKGLLILAEEMALSYGARLEDAERTVEAVQYPDLAQWLNDLLDDEDTALGREHWQGRSVGVAESSTEARGSFQPRSMMVPLDRRTAGLLRESIKEGSIGESLLACWAALWQRTGNQTNFDLVHDGRRHEALSRALGPLSRQLPLHISLGPESSFVEVVEEVRRECEEAVRWEDFFDPEASPYHEVAVPQFELRIYPSPVSVGSATLSVLPLRVCTDRFSIKLCCELRDGELFAEIQHDAILWPKIEVWRLAGQLVALMADAFTAPDKRVAELDLLGETERWRLLQELNDTRVPFALDQCIHQLFQDRAGRSPDVMALAGDGWSLSFGDLETLANRLAHHLRRLGVVPEVRVALCAERSPDLVIAALAILKAGGVLVLLDPSYPEEWRARALEDCAAPILLTQSIVARLACGAREVCLDRDMAAWQGESGEPPAVEVAPANAAYILYTSGSTGAPKGVAVPHAALVNHLLWLQRVDPLEELDCALLKTPIGFDVAVREIFWPLVAGARLVMARPGGHRDASYLADLMARYGVTVLNSVPSLLLALLDEPKFLACHSLRRVFCGGEEMLPALHDRFFARLPALLYNQYGPTEATITTLRRHCRPGERLERVPIGRPIANVRAYVLDSSLQPVPAGTTGELYLGGAGLARGYLGRTDLTAERFVPDPFGGEGGERLYRTGDLVRHRLDGEIEFFGRADHQVKIRGVRIEPMEIEAVLYSHPAVREAAVGAWGAGESKHLVGYIVPQPGQTLAVGELGRLVRDRLPDGMRPAIWMVLGELPRTHSGKLDRRALPPPVPGRPSPALPRTELQAWLATVWGEFLSHAEIGPEDDFFALGGHSLLGARLIARVRGALGVDLPLRTIFEAPSLAGLAERIELLLRGGAAAPEPIEPASREAEIPLSFAQQRLWFIDRLDPGSAAYNIPAAARLRGDLEVAILSRVLSAIVHRHEVLRTVFPGRSGRPVQEILPPAPCPLPLVDLGGLDTECREREAARLATEEARRPFDLERGPLLRNLLLCLTAGEHLLVATMHHIVSDGWSRGVFVRELTALYRALAHGEHSFLPELSVQYADFSVWQRRSLREEALATDLAYWKGRLGSGTDILRLPADRPRPPVRRHHGCQHPVALPAELSEALVELGRSRGCTLFMMLLATFQTLLLRYTGQSQIRVGSPVSGRDRVEVESLIGFFVNTLVMATDLGEDPPFTELLHRVRETVLEAWAHRALPFERLVEELQPQRDLAHTPLFQVALALQNTPQEELRLPGLAVLPLELDTGTSKFDLTLALFETPGGIRGSLEYDSDLFEPATIDRLAGHFGSLLGGIVAGVGTRLYDLPLLVDTEREQLLSVWNAPPAVGAPTEPIHALFTARAACDPDAVAVICEGETLTYGALDRHADQLARLLASRGARLETPVGILLEPSIGMIVAILGVLKAGGTYVPLDPASPPERLAGLLREVGASLLVTDDRPASALPATDAAVLRLDLARGLASEAEGALAVEVPVEALAYVIFTSGSTGRPKGVAVTHANVVRLFTATRSWVGPSAADVWTLFHSHAFDFSVWEIWGALLFGGRLVIVPLPARRSPEVLLALLRERKVTVLSQTPSAFRQLVRADGETRGKPLPMRLVILGGEALDPQGVQSWFDRHGDSYPRVVNLYGITETTVHVTWRALRRTDLERAVIPIGIPIPDLAVHLLDRGQRLVPTGVPGEVLVGGAGLARGYVGRPELTAERFVPDPFRGTPGARLYRSGDLARWIPTGELEYLGRTDGQVKVRGFRIEPGEIEAALSASPEVAESVILAREDSSRHTSLVAYVVPRPGRHPRIDSLRQHLRQRLPEHMLPGAFVLLETLPLTPNGKLDRAALPVPGHLRPDLEVPCAEPADEVEEVLAGVWSQVLGLTEVGVLDNFFALGGDSILSLRVQSLARERGLSFPLQDLFRHQTVRDLARQVRQPSGERPEDEAVRPFELLSRADREKLPPGLEDAYPLTAVQSGMLYHMSYMPDEIVYHNVYSYDLRVRFDADAFARVLERVMARHAILRTSFDLPRYTEPLQLVHAAVPLPLRTADLGHLDAAAQDAVVRELLEEEKRTRFDLSRPPLLRLCLCRRSDEVVNLILTEFHPIFDGWSLHSFLREVFDGYLALLNGRELPGDRPPALSVCDFVRLERQALESRECRAFWDERLRDCAILELTRWRGTPSDDRHGRIRHLRYQFPEELFVGVKRLARSCAVPIKTVLLSAHLKVLSLLGGPDVLTGLVVSGRPEGPDADLVLGLFFNVVPFRMVLEQGTWSDLARATFECEREMLPFRRYPLAQMQKSRGGRPLFDVLFNYIHFYSLAGTLSEIDLKADFGKWEETNLPLSISCEQDPLSRRLRLSLRYDIREFAAPQMEGILGLYRRVLHDMIESPEASHGRRPFLSLEARHQILTEWNQTPPRVQRAGYIHDLFTEQARRIPEALAVVCGGERLTYAELSLKASRIASCLRRAGVCPETRVGLYIRRSTDFVAALLGVLGTGGAYLPLDPTYPPERLAFMIEDAGAPFVLTHGSLEPPSSPGTTVLRLEELFSEPERAGQEPDAGAGSAAYVLYTSGSTGQPKGVVVEHRQVLSYLDGILQHLPSPTGRRFAMVSTFAADLGNTVLFPALCCGGCLHVVPEEHASDPDWLAGHFFQHGIDVLKIVPSHLAALLTTSRPERLLPREMLVLGGEACEWSLARKIASLAPGCRILNHYGPTETTVGVAVFPVGSGAPHPECATVPVGRPLAGSRLYLLGSELHPVPVGVRGEVYIGGAGVSRGYLNRCALTAERFVPDPFADQPGERLYKTGDLARWLPDGCMEFLGRADHQVKIRGFRIELVEIETVLKRHASVREAAVVVHRDATGELRVAAYIVSASEEPPETSELRSFLRRSLPDFMIPSAFVLLAALPRKMNGKVDALALPPPGETSLSGHPAFQPPRSVLELSLAALWREVLQVDVVGVDDNFFDLGGHSLFMLRMHSKLREALDPSLSMATLFEHPTIASLARYLAGGRETRPEAIEPEDRAEARRRSLRARAELRRSTRS